MKDTNCENEHPDLTPEEVVNIANRLNKIIDKKNNKNGGWWKRLLDKNDSSVSSSSFYLVSVTLVGLLLLLVPIVVLIIEVIHNHTVTTDLNGMAAYIAAVAGLFASGGIVKGWISYNDAKTNNRKCQLEQNNNSEQEEISSECD